MVDGSGWCSGDAGWWMDMDMDTSSPVKSVEFLHPST